MHAVVRNPTLRGLHLSTQLVVRVVMHAEVDVNKLTSSQHIAHFLRLRFQRKVVRDLALATLPGFEELDTCAKVSTMSAKRKMTP